MQALFDRLKKEPAVVIGILAAAVLAAVKSLAGDGILDGDVADWIGKALNPADGWALPIIVGFITRQFVFSPPKVQEIADGSTYLAAGTKVDIGDPPAGPDPSTPPDPGAGTPPPVHPDSEGGVG